MKGKKRNGAPSASESWLWAPAGLRPNSVLSGLGNGDDGTEVQEISFVAEIQPFANLNWLVKEAPIIIVAKANCSDGSVSVETMRPTVFIQWVEEGRSR